MVLPRIAHGIACKASLKLPSLRTGPLAGILLTSLVLSAPMVAAQNINDLLRILLPPAPTQPSSTVRTPGEYAPPQPAPQFPMARPPQTLVAPQAPRGQVMQMQQRLNGLGYDAGIADGVAGRKTIDALNAFRRDHGLAVSATVDKQSVAAVSSVHANTNSGTQAVSLATATPTAAKPSFDCARAASPTELALCNDAALSALDLQLAGLYAQELAQREPQASSTLKDEQRQWLSQRNKCLGDRSCLLNAYAQRIASITSPADPPAQPFTGATPRSGAYVSAPVTAIPQEEALATSDMAPDDTQPGSVRATGTDLRTLANSPAGLQPITFRYFDGMPILQPSTSASLFTLMSFADELPPREQECYILRASLLTEEVVRQFMGKQNHQCWQGKDEFQAADTRRDFYARYMDTIKSFAPKPPFRMVFIQRNRLGQYDADPGQFRLAEKLNQGLGANFSLGSSRRLNISIGSSWPEPTLPADEATARSLLEKVRASVQGDPKAKNEFRTDRDVNVVGVIDVLSADYTAKRLDIGLVSLSLYDSGLHEKIYEFPLAPSFDVLIKGNIPERFNIPSPAPLDTLYALVQSLWYDKDVGEEIDHRWRQLYDQLRQRDKAFYAAIPQEKLNDDDVRLPVFAANAGDYDSHDREQLEKWVAAYRAGLPKEVEVLGGQGGASPTLDMEGRRYLFGPMEYRASHLDDYTEILKAEGVQKEQVSRWHGAEYVTTLLITPNRLDLYTLAVERSKLAQVGWRQRTLFRTGPIKQATDSKGKRVLIMYVEPVSLTIEHDGGVIAQRNYQDIPHLDGSFVATQQNVESSATADGPLGLSPALLDLLALNALGEKLSEPAVAHMAARRWRFEHEQESVVGGNFFVKGMRQPEPQELAEITPKFREWVTSAVPAIPVTLRVGASVPNSYPSSHQTVDWSVLGCSDSAMQPLDLQNKIKRDGPALAAYTALKQHDTHSRNKIIGDTRMWEINREFDLSMEKASGVAHWTAENDERLVNLKAASGIVDRYQRIGDICGLSAEELGYPNPAAIYLEIQDALPGVKQKQSAPPLNAEISLEITGIRLAVTEPHFSDLLPPKFVDDYKFAPPKRMPMEAIVFESRLKEVVYFDRNGQELARLTPNAAYSMQAHLDSIKAFYAAQRSSPVKELDVVGIKLGMTMEAAEKIIRNQMDVGRVLEGKRLYDGSLKSGQLIPATSGKLFISKDERELIAILDEPPAVQGKVMAAWRRVYISAGTVPINEATVALYDKYGEPTMSSKRAVGMAYMWRSGGQHDCLHAHSPGARLALAANWTENGERAEVKLSDGVPTPDASLPVPYRDPFNPEYRKIAECGPAMSAELNFEATQWMSSGVTTRQMDWIEQSLTDVAAYMQAFNASREATKGKQGNDGDTSNKQQRAGGLKF